jgi:hypothetical protein
VDANVLTVMLGNTQTDHGGKEYGKGKLRKN